jgi:hypothetical protein
MTKDCDQYSDTETAKRMERALKRSLTMKPIPHKKRKASRIGVKVPKAKKPTDSA